MRVSSFHGCANWRCTLSVALLTACMFYAVPSRADSMPKKDIAPSFRLSGDKVVIPFMMVGPIPFIEAEVDGIKGKLMLDTGAEAALQLNSHLIPMKAGTPDGQGAVGSGNTFAVAIQDHIADVKLGPELRFHDVKLVRSQDAAFMEKLTPDFLGWTGYNLWHGYAMKLDYATLTATFYKDPAGSDDVEYLKGEVVVAQIPFELRKLPNHPIVQLKIGSLDFVGAFDTSQLGHLVIDAPTQARMLREKSILEAGIYRGDPAFNVKDVAFANGVHLPVSGITVLHNAVLGPLGLDSNNVITFGHAFLKHYRTVWDFKRRTIYLLRQPSAEVH